MMTIQECIQYVENHLEIRPATSNGAYTCGSTVAPNGSVNHSVGCAQPNVDVFFRNMNKSSAGWGVNALLGDFHNGEGRIILTLRFDSNTKRCSRNWGVGSGKKGSWNNTRIQWEICEPAGHTYAGGTMIGYDIAKNQGYFDRMWKMVVAWNVYCAVVFGYDADMIGDHAESYKAGMGSNHGDVGHWWPKHGKTMDDLRAEVRAILSNNGTNTEEDETMVIYKYLGDIPAWYKNAVEKVIDKGALNGTGNGELNVSEDFCRMLTVLDRLGKLD